MQSPLGEVTRRVREPLRRQLAISCTDWSRAARVSAGLLAWPTRSGAGEAEPQQPQKRGTKFIPTQGHLWSSPRGQLKAPEASGCRLDGQERQDSVEVLAVGWGCGEKNPARERGGRETSRGQAGAEDARRLSATAGRLRLGGGSAWPRIGRRLGRLADGRAGEGGRPLRRAGGDWRRRAAAPRRSCLHPWHGEAAAAAAAQEPGAIR